MLGETSSSTAVKKHLALISHLITKQLRQRVHVTKPAEQATSSRKSNSEFEIQLKIIITQKKHQSGIQEQVY